MERSFERIIADEYIFMGRVVTIIVMLNAFQPKIESQSSVELSFFSNLDEYRICSKTMKVDKEILCFLTEIGNHCIGRFELEGVIGKFRVSPTFVYDNRHLYVKLDSVVVFRVVSNEKSGKGDVDADKMHLTKYGYVEWENDTFVIRPREDSSVFHIIDKLQKEEEHDIYRIIWGVMDFEVLTFT